MVGGKEEVGRGFGGEEEGAVRVEVFGEGVAVKGGLAGRDPVVGDGSGGRGGRVLDARRGAEDPEAVGTIGAYEAPGEAPAGFDEQMSRTTRDEAAALAKEHCEIQTSRGQFEHPVYECPKPSQFLSPLGTFGQVLLRRVN